MSKTSSVWEMRLISKAGNPGSLTSKMQYKLAKKGWHVMEMNCHRQPQLSQIILHPDTNCRRISGGHIAQVAFLPLESSGGSPLSPRGVPIDGPRNTMHPGAVLFTIPNQGFRKGLLHCSKSDDEIPFPGFIKPQKSGPAVMIALDNSKNY